MSAEDPRPLYVELPIRVKTYDIDFVGHVNNIVYIRWLEDLRLHLLDTYYPLDELRAIGMAPIIVTTQIHYKQGIVLDDRDVTGRMWLEKLDRATFHLAAEFRVSDGVRCTAAQRGTFVDLAKMRPTRIPQRLREAYDRFQAP